MIDKEMLEESLEKAMKNKYWKEQYENAPSEECKEYLKYTFCYSDNFDPEENEKEFDELQKEVEGKLAVDDWEYLKEMVPNSPFVGYCNMKIKELNKIS